MKKRKECERKDQEGTLGADMGQIRGRADVMSYAMLAEINTFHNNRAGDIKQASQRFLQEQIEYYQQVTWYINCFFRVLDLPTRPTGGRKIFLTFFQDAFCALVWAPLAEESS